MEPWGVDSRRINANVIGPGFFKTLGIPVLRGRDFDERDDEGHLLVVIVNETAVRIHFHGQDPIGSRVSFNGPQGPWCKIVGIVRDSKYGALGETPLPVVYMPVAQNHETGMTLYVRASVPPGSLIGSIRREIQAIEPNLPCRAPRRWRRRSGHRSTRRAWAHGCLLCSAGSPCCSR